jgi:hypothetical protein
MMEHTKRWWESKTIWVNVILLTIAILGVFLDFKVLDPEVVAIASAILNVILRFVTTEPVK